MAVVKWAPFSAFTALEQEVHSLVDRMGARPLLEGFGWKPDTDIYREKGALVVEAELPGLDPRADLEIDIEDGVLQIKGSKDEAKEISETDEYVRERRYGSFCRSVVLPEGVDGESVTATYDNGILVVKIPLPEATPEQETQRVKIDVTPGTESPSPA